MGSIGENQAFGQGKPGYNAGRWDNFGVSSKLDTIEQSLQDITIPDVLDPKTDANTIKDINKDIDKQQTVLDKSRTDLGRNPQPDIMSNNQVEEAQVLQERLNELQREVDTKRRQLSLAMRR